MYVFGISSDGWPIYYWGHFNDGSGRLIDRLFISRLNDNYMNDINIYLEHSEKKGIYTFHYSIPHLHQTHKFGDFQFNHSLKFLAEQKKECKKIIDYLNNTVKKIDERIAKINNSNHPKLF